MAENVRNVSVRTRIRSAWLTTIKHTLNPLTLRIARRRHGPFVLVRHTGRRSGTVYETPLIVAPSADGFVAELTYGPTVAWYLNVVAAGRCTIVRHGESFEIDRIAPLSTPEGLAAFGRPRSWLLRLLRRHEFLTLHVEGRPAAYHELSGQHDE